MPRLLLLVVLAFTAIVLAVAATTQDLYKLLGVSRTATEPEIKRAYKKLSRKYHPDKNSAPDAEAQFIAISEAYEVLSDDDKRQIYDRYGHEGLKQHEQGAGARQHQRNPFDMFSRFFGGQHHGAQERKGPDLRVQMQVDLTSFFVGNYEEFSVPRKILCDHCSGTGAASKNDIKICSTCQGQGIVLQKAQIFPGMYTNVQSACPTCAGKGKTIAKPCKHCKGHKIVEITNPLSFYLPPGAKEGWEMVFDGESDESPEWDIAGDVVVSVTSHASPEWRRKDSGLYRRETLAIDEALLGFERNITHLDGSIVQVVRTGTTQPGHVDVIKGRGVGVSCLLSFHRDLKRLT